MANEKNIIIKDGEQLHRIMDKVEKVIDQNERNMTSLDEKIEAATGETRASLETLKASVEKNQSDVNDMKERLVELDKVLPRGDKVYTSIVQGLSPEAETEARREFANLVCDSVLVARRSRPKFSSYSRIQTEYGELNNAGNTEGGYLVNEQYLPSILRVIENYGVVRRLFKRIPMTSNKVRIPTNAAPPTVYWDTSMSERELVGPTPSGVTFARPEMEAHKLIAIDTMSIEVLEDSIPMIQDFVVDMFMLAMAKEEDRTGLVAPAATAGEPFQDGGILKNASVAAVTGSAQTYLASLQDDNSTSGGYAKLLALMDAADESTAETGTFVFSNSILNAIRQVKDTTGVPLWGQMVGAAPNTIFGRPFVRSRVMPKQSDGSQNGKAFMIYGDFNYAFMGDRRQISIDVSEHAAFKEFGMVLRVAERIAFKTPLTTPFAVLKAAA